MVLKAGGVVHVASCVGRVVQRLLKLALGSLLELPIVNFKLGDIAEVCVEEAISNDGRVSRAEFAGVVLAEHETVVETLDCVLFLCESLLEFFRLVQHDSCVVGKAAGFLVRILTDVRPIASVQTSPTPDAQLLVAAIAPRA